MHSSGGMLWSMSAIQNAKKKQRVAVVSAVDKNPRYEHCQSYFEESWKCISKRSLHEYTPIVVNISSERAFDLGNRSFHLPAAIDTAFLAQNVRSPAGSILKEFDLVMTSDIDMFPLNPTWFDGMVEMSSRTESLIIGRNVLAEEQYPICYNLAPPSTWATLFKIESRSDLEKTLLALWRDAASESNGYDGKHGGSGWHYDQTSLFRLVNQAAELGMSIGFYEQGATSAHRRLDRTLRPKFLRWLALPFLSHLRLTDYHTHLPVRENLNFLDALMEALAKEVKGTE